MQDVLRRQPERAVGIAGLPFVVPYAVPAILWGGVQADEPAAQVAHELVAHRGAAVVVGSGSPATPFRGVGPFWLLGLVGTLVWIVATSIRLLVRRLPRLRRSTCELDLSEQQP